MKFYRLGSYKYASAVYWSRWRYKGNSLILKDNFDPPQEVYVMCNNKKEARVALAKVNLGMFEDLLGLTRTNSNLKPILPDQYFNYPTGSRAIYLYEDRPFCLIPMYIGRINPQHDPNTCPASNLKGRCYRCYQYAKINQGRAGAEAIGDIIIHGK